LSNPRITVGMPVYKGADHVAKALDCLQRQTFGDFEAIISVDGADEETATACRPFLADSRFRLVVQPQRLDWFGNFNWLLQQDLREFFCYRQHDDTTAPEFFEVLLREAERAPDAAIVYCDCQWFGGRHDVESAPSIEGEPLARMLRYVEDIPATPVRGLIRGKAIRQAGLIRHDEFRGLCEIIVWLAKVLRCGNFRRVPQPLYYRLDHADNFSKSWNDWPYARKRAAWTTMFTGLLEAAMPLCRTAQERLFLQQVILDRVVVFRPGRNYLYRPSNEPQSCGSLIAECLDRLKFEGNEHLIGFHELPGVLLQASFRLCDLPARVDELPARLAASERERGRLETELMVLKRSRMLKLGRLIRRLVGAPLPWS
jgi:glycosyltransferase involved in cell wall biosynthesis